MITIADLFHNLLDVYGMMVFMSLVLTNAAYRGTLSALLIKTDARERFQPVRRERTGRIAVCLKIHLEYII